MTNTMIIFDRFGNSFGTGSRGRAISMGLRFAPLGNATPDSVFMTDTGEVQTYNLDQLERRSVKPAPHLQWRNDVMGWVDIRDLSVTKSETAERLKAQRNEIIHAPKTTSVGTFDATQKSVSDLNAVIQLTKMAAERGLPATANFTLTSNERVTLTLEELEMAALEMGAQVQAVYDQYDPIINQVRAATTLAELDAIELP